MYEIGLCKNTYAIYFGFWANDICIKMDIVLELYMGLMGQDIIMSDLDMRVHWTVIWFG